VFFSTVIFLILKKDILHDYNIEDILKLSKSERILIVEKIWDSIADDTEGSGLPKWKKQLIEERLAEYDKNKNKGEDWEYLKKRYSDK